MVQIPSCMIFVLSLDGMVQIPLCMIFVLSVDGMVQIHACVICSFSRRNGPDSFMYDLFSL